MIRMMQAVVSEESLADLLVQTVLYWISSTVSGNTQFSKGLFLL